MAKPGTMKPRKVSIIPSWAVFKAFKARVVSSSSRSSSAMRSLSALHPLYDVALYPLGPLVKSPSFLVRAVVHLRGTLIPCRVTGCNRGLELVASPRCGGR
jgi:hypothetical protein